MRSVPDRNHRPRRVLQALWLIGFSACVLVSCRTKEQSHSDQDTATLPDRPAFSADSAYRYVEEQVALGPRIPGTDPHRKCADLLAQKLEQFGATVIRQNTTVAIYNGKKVPCYNIIGSYNPQVSRRLLLCSHWDSRPFADQERLPSDQKKPFDSADDGPSGVGVLLEVARQLQQRDPGIGVDIIFFDVEDYGPPAFEESVESDDSYCLGTQYWCRNPHVAGYKAENGILLDMVGGKGAAFTFEGLSMQYAQSFMKQVWNHAATLGHSGFFVRQPTDPIIDDHYYLNTIAGIPSIDIIARSNYTRTRFAAHWHTLQDNMQVIDKSVLQAVGETVLLSVYEF